MAGTGTGGPDRGWPAPPGDTLPPMVGRTAVLARRSNGLLARSALLDARLLLPAVIVLAAANFLWQLGSSSYFVDEVLSIQHALPSLGTVDHLVTHTETTPWTYFWGLHLWLHLTGSQGEWVTRLPQALAGIGLIGAVYWMARAFAARPGAVLAALLTAISPLVLTYAQRVRVYVFALLALTVAVGLVVRAARDHPLRTRRLTAGAATAVLAMWLHYTAVLVVAPLGVWLVLQRQVPVRSRVAFSCACLAGGFLELPLFLRQYEYSPNGGVGAAGGISVLNVVRVLGTPFDGRFVAPVNAFRIVSLVVVGVCMLALATGAGGRVRQPRLLVALALTAPLVILILGLAGKDVVITRYTVVAAPLLLTAVAVSISSLPRVAGSVTALMCATVSIWGLARVHERSGFYPPAREAISYIRSHPAPGAVLALPGHAGADVPLAFYAQRLLHPLPAFIEGTDRRSVAQALRARQPLWSVHEYRSVRVSPAAIRRFLTRVLAPEGYRPAQVAVIATSSTLVVELLTPGARLPARRSG